MDKKESLFPRDLAWLQLNHSILALPKEERRRALEQLLDINNVEYAVAILAYMSDVPEDVQDRATERVLAADWYNLTDGGLYLQTLEFSFSARNSITRYLTAHPEYVLKFPLRDDGCRSDNFREFMTKLTDSPEVVSVVSNHILSRPEYASKMNTFWLRRVAEYIKTRIAPADEKKKELLEAIISYTPADAFRPSSGIAYLILDSIDQFVLEPDARQTLTSLLVERVSETFEVGGSGFKVLERILYKDLQRRCIEKFLDNGDALSRSYQIINYIRGLSSSQWEWVEGLAFEKNHENARFDDERVRRVLDDILPCWAYHPRNSLFTERRFSRRSNQLPVFERSGWKLLDPGEPSQGMRFAFIGYEREEENRKTKSFMKRLRRGKTAQAGERVLLVRKDLGLIASDIDPATFGHAIRVDPSVKSIKEAVAWAAKHKFQDFSE